MCLGVHIPCVVDTVPRTIECLSCGRRFLAFESMGPKPIDYDECPDCGEAEFEYVDDS